MYEHETAAAEYTDYENDEQTIYVDLDESRQKDNNDTCSFLQKAASSSRVLPACVRKRSMHSWRSLHSHFLRVTRERKNKP